MRRKESRERQSIVPTVETVIVGQPLVTISDIDWSKIFELIGEGRKAHLKQVTISGANIQSMHQLTQLWETKGDFGVYSASKGEITLNVDRIFNYNLYLLFRENELFRYADGEIFIVPLQVEMQLGLALLSTLAHEAEHSLQPNNNLIYNLLIGIELSTMLLSSLFVLELGSIELQSLLATWLCSQLSVTATLRHLRRQAEVPYIDKPDEIMARAKAAQTREHYEQSGEKLPFTFKIDWKRLYHLANQ